jgi:hypothetical protein
VKKHIANMAHLKMFVFVIRASLETLTQKKVVLKRQKHAQEIAAVKMQFARPADRQLSAFANLDFMETVTLNVSILTNAHLKFVLKTPFVLIRSDHLTAAVKKASLEIPSLCAHPYLKLIARIPEIATAVLRKISVHRDINVRRVDVSIYAIKRNAVHLQHVIKTASVLAFKAIKEIQMMSQKVAH